MPRLYRIGAEWAGTQAEARKSATRQGTHFHAVDVPTDKAGLLAFLNGRHCAAQPVQAAPGDPAPAAPAEPPSLEQRGLAAIEAYVGGRDWVRTDELQSHLEREHRIAVSRFWIGERLERIGWQRQPHSVAYARAGAYVASAVAGAVASR